MHTSNRSRPHCRFFNTPRGCREGENCRFLHATDTEQASSRAISSVAACGLDATNTTNSRPRQAGLRDSSKDSAVNIGLFHRLLKRLVSSPTGPLDPQLLQQWVQLCEQLVKSNRVPLLLEKLGQDEYGIRLCTMLLPYCPDKVKV
jgi:hypothetical protein